MPARAHEVGELEDLLDRGDGTLLGFLLATAPDAAGVTADEFVVDGGLQDGLQEAVGLGGGGLLAVLDQRGAPGPDLGSSDLLQLGLAERRFQVQAEEAAVQLVGEGCEVAFVDPGGGVEEEVDGSRVGVAPFLAAYVGLGLDEPGFGVALGREGLLGVAQEAVGAG
ncbi:hypothetical protein GCM10010495_10950 [Kitasatospora herbaricolor]|nr:hypothetical protein [Kitasatospora herbaricolor]MDQ0309468.1 hypothetical protein [Kitasatospora herbaricolor]GGV01643.1 hypothetical protein GCM10010495_10950 [Kitasatospora herbaricolor]